LRIAYRVWLVWKKVLSAAGRAAGETNGHSRLQRSACRSFQTEIPCTTSPKVMIKVAVCIGVRMRSIVAFLESLTGKLPANFATVPTLPPASVTPPRESSKE